LKEKEYVKLGRTEQRPYWAMLGSVLVRALHQLGAGVFLGAVLLMQSPVPRAFVVLASMSGGVLWLLEWWRHREILRELGGVATIIKLVLIGAAVHGMLPDKSTLVVVFLLASVCAHLPKNLRHRMLF